MSNGRACVEVEHLFRELPRVHLHCSSALVTLPAKNVTCTSGDRTGLGSCKDILRAPTSVSASSCVSSLELAVPASQNHGFRTG
eukprot:scaffold1875_cov339-Prasinococcus_capsulatus_cf.AAC.4